MKTPDCIPPLERAGISRSDAFALRRVSMQLHRWHERECGTSYGCVERDEETGKTYWLDSYTGRRTPTRDMETLALKRLGKILAAYPDLKPYIQGDPRGCALYILRPGDVPAGEQVDSYYSRGLAVYK